MGFPLAFVLSDPGSGTTPCLVPVSEALPSQPAKCREEVCHALPAERVMCSQVRHRSTVSLTIISKSNISEKEKSFFVTHI